MVVSFNFQYAELGSMDQVFKKENCCIANAQTCLIHPCFTTQDTHVQFNYSYSTLDFSLAKSTNSLAFNIAK